MRGLGSLSQWESGRSWDQKRHVSAIECGRLVSLPAANAGVSLPGKQEREENKCCSNQGLVRCESDSTFGLMSLAHVS
jgi:hypothetical protein